MISTDLLFVELAVIALVALGWAAGALCLCCYEER